MLTTILALVVSAAIDSTTLFIGDQTDLHLRATCEVGEQVQLPELDKELIPGIEIVDKTVVDTATLSDGRVQYNQYLTLTSFEDSLFYIAPLPFVSGDDTVWSESLMLNVVQPFEMDSADMAITDIKGIYNAPIWWWGILRWVLLALAIAGVGVGGYYLITYLRQHSFKGRSAGSGVHIFSVVCVIFVVFLKFLVGIDNSHIFPFNTKYVTDDPRGDILGVCTVSSRCTTA